MMNTSADGRLSMQMRSAFSVVYWGMRLIVGVVCWEMRLIVGEIDALDLETATCAKGVGNQSTGKRCSRSTRMEQRPLQEQWHG